MENITKKHLIKKGQEKEALDFILTNCFRAGFGTVPKSEIDLILFTALLKYSDENVDNDYELSKYLQITQRQISNLKEKASVKYLQITSEEAISIFLDKANSAKLDDKYIEIPINNIAVKNEIEAILDKNDILLQSQLNPKIFRLRVDDFFELIILFESILNRTDNKETAENRVIEVLKGAASKNKEAMGKISKQENDLLTISKKTLKEGLVKGGFSLLIDLLTSLIPGGAFISEPIKKLFDTFKRNTVK